MTTKSKLTPSQILARIKAVMSGRVSAKYLAAEAGRTASDQDVKNIKGKAKGGRVKKRK